MINSETAKQAAALAEFLRPYRTRLFVGVAALLAASACGLAFPLLAGALIDASLPGQAFGLLLPSGYTPTQISLALVAVIAVQTAAAYVHARAFSWAGQSMLADLRTACYERVLGMPLAYFGGRRVGELTSRIASDVVQLEAVVVEIAPQICRQSVILLGSLVLTAATSRRLAVVVVATLPVLVLTAMFFGRKFRHLARETQDCAAEANTVVEETLQAIPSVKAFANEAWEIGRYDRANRAHLSSTLAANRWRVLFSAIFGGGVITLWFAAGLAQLGSITPGELARFMLYATFVAGAVRQVAELFGQVQRALGASQRIRELLTTAPEDESVTRGTPPPGGLPARLHGNVVFDGVSFSYPDRPDALVLDRLSLTVRQGETVALVGPSGAGKSTLTALLLRLYDPTHGQVRIDDRDARAYPRPWLRRQIAIVPQDILLFGGTIAENIAYGRIGATPAEIREAARLAHADEFIRRFPDGYDTRVGDRGTKLSGGQRQRIAIARAILKDPAILILDEATSSLDSESERLIQEAWRHLVKGRTTLIIAHRLSTVRHAQQIAVIRNGHVVEFGPHDTLFAQHDGYYRHLCRVQFDLPDSPKIKDEAAASAHNAATDAAT